MDDAIGIVGSLPKLCRFCRTISTHIVFSFAGLAFRISLMTSFGSFRWPIEAEYIEHLRPRLPVRHAQSAPDP